MTRNVEGLGLGFQIGSFFAWLLSLPLYGPLLYNLEILKGAAPGQAGRLFALSHGATLLAFGWLLTRLAPSREVVSKWARASLGFCAFITLGLCFAPLRYWTFLLIVAGSSSSVFVLDWAFRFAHRVTRDARPRVMAAGMIAANVFYGAMLALGPALGGLSATLVALAPLAATAVAVIRDREARPTAVADTVGPVEAPLWKPEAMSWFYPLILVFYTIGGLYYELTLPFFRDVPVNAWFQVIPYIAALAWAAGRFELGKAHSTAMLAIAMMGISYAVSPILPPVPGYYLSLSLINVSFAVLDLYLWVSLAGIASGRPFYRTYGLGLGLNVAGIHLGGLLSSTLIPLASTNTMVTCALVAVSLLFAASYSLGHLMAPAGLDAAGLRRQPAASHPTRTCTQGLRLPDHLAQKLTPRERQVAELLLEAIPNAEIENRLGLAAGTLKTHINHIYQKTGVNSRHKLMMLAISGDDGVPPKIPA